LLINLGEVEDKRFELSELAGRVFKAPATSLRLIKNVLDKVKRDLGNRPSRIDALFAINFFTTEKGIKKII
jgi:hypothetical protein